MSTRKTVSFFQYPYPAEPRNWTEEERAYGRGLKRLFDILFSRKLQNVLIADKAVDARTIDDGAVQLHHLREGFGADLDITENESVTTLETGVAQAQSTADGLTDKLMPVGITVITSTSPSYGIWSQITVDGMTAWTRIS